ncbi:MAG: hypothetical protein AAFY45_12480 [Bacteroidota bacterium]
MIKHLSFCLCSMILLYMISCQEPKPTAPTFEEEKAAILATINNETKAAFQRDYESWQSKWVHAPYVVKTYIEFPDSSFSESLGWEKINHFVKTYIEEHPEADPLPELLADIDVRLYGSGAWVSFEVDDEVRGLKRETRLMEKVEGKWKIAGMHTTIYGTQKPD